MEEKHIAPVIRNRIIRAVRDGLDEAWEDPFWAQLDEADDDSRAPLIDVQDHPEHYTMVEAARLLATLLGTACTAPFLAGATAYAFSQPMWVVFLVFTSAGLGMALPYLVLSAKPAWLRFIPKPGPWMVTFKQAAGFVLLGTAVWLLWILASQLDGRGVVWTVGFWGFLGLAVWMLGKITPTWNTGPRAATST